jgi:hypothetical protein
VLHVVKLGNGAGGAGQPPVAGHVGHPLAVDKDLPAVAKRFEELLAGADGHSCRSFPQTRLP